MEGKLLKVFLVQLSPSVTLVALMLLWTFTQLCRVLIRMYIISHKVFWNLNIDIFYSGAKRKKLIDVRNKNTLRYSGWDPSKKNVIIIHGFNGTESKTPMTIIRNGWLSILNNNRKYCILMVITFIAINDYHYYNN